MVYFLLNKINIMKSSNQAVPYSVVGLSRVFKVQRVQGVKGVQGVQGSGGKGYRV